MNDIECLEAGTDAPAGIPASAPLHATPDQLEQRLAEGLEHHQAGRHDEAERIYADALRQYGDDPTALYLSGLLAFETGRHAASVDLLARLTKVRPDRVEAWAALAAAQVWLSQFEAAARSYRRVLQIAPDDAAALVGLPEALREAGDLPAALATGEAAIERLPDRAAARLGLAATLLRMGRTAQAVDAYREAIRLEPDAPGVLAGLALASVQVGEAQAALKAAERAVALDATLAAGWLAKGSALAALHRHEAAIEALTQALSLEPNLATAHHALGNACLELGRLEEAEASLLRAVELNPSPSRPYASLGALYLRMNHADQARRSYEAALACDPEMTVAHVNLAALLTDAGETERAKGHRDAAYSRENLLVDGPAEGRLRVLVLASAGQGNVPTQHLFDADRHQRIVWFIAYMHPGQIAELPDYDIVFNALGEPDQALPAEVNLEAFRQVVRRPLLNAPDRVADTARHRTPDRLAGLEDVVVPKTVRLSAQEIGERGLRRAVEASGVEFPLLVRPQGSHGGKGLMLARSPEALDDYPLQPGEAVYVTAFHDFHSDDGLYRKYRMIFVDRKPMPYHLAIAREWLVHHASSNMSADAARKTEELNFLRDPERAIGARAMAAVAAIARRLDLDYAGLDFSVLPDGRVLVFEANATMLVHPESEQGPFAGKNPFVRRIIAAFHDHLDRVAAR